MLRTFLSGTILSACLMALVFQSQALAETWQGQLLTGRGIGKGKGSSQNCSSARGCLNIGRAAKGCASKYGYPYHGPHDYAPDVFQPDLFYNYYAGANSGANPASMYPSPGPAPPWVGHTFYTYQPFMPHEMMYKHHRIYHRYYNHQQGLNRTIVSHSPSITASFCTGLRWAIEPAR